MKVTKIIAPTMPEAMKKIRMELGNDAVIINSKVAYTGGFLGLFKKKNIEVIAALDTNLEKRIKPKQTEGRDVATKLTPAVEFKEEKVQTDSFQKEFTELKQMIQHLSHLPATTDAEYPKGIQEMLMYLQSQGIHQDSLNELGDFLLSKLENTSEIPKEVESLSKEWFRLQMSSFDFGGIDYSKKYINVIGPTGVGKTTTLAKIAAEAVLAHGKMIAFMTTDTYRIAAIEQLKTYAQLLNVPVEVVYDRADYAKSVEKHQDADMVFIDTAGRNYREIQYIQDLTKIIDFAADMETILVLSLTSKESDLEAIIENFSELNIQKFIFTKVDETSSYGSSFNLLKKYQKGAAYLTNGQDVPDDIVQADAEKVIQLLFKGFPK
ncbi:flagellar biosynthesis protein FlhF [Bacillus sp. 2205SS5-2]|uniref:flagellar biosynthesis protein FlhF n=1 Tax=Bacillus sp. 2205SS5-2 TaxID=3109031 RepID=UPI0030074034